MKYYIENKPIQDQVEDKYKYIFIAKEIPENSQFTIEERNKIISERINMFNQFGFGVYDIGNNGVEISNIASPSNVYHMLCDLCLVYKINPINARVTGHRVCVSKFTVENVFDNIYDFIDDLNEECANLVFGQLFNIKFDDTKEKVIDIFKYYHDKFPERKINMSSCILDYNILGYKDKMIEFINNGYVYLDEHDKSKILDKLISNKWFNILLQYIKTYNVTKEDIINDNRLIQKTHVPIVKEIIELLGIDKKTITIKVYDEDSMIEKFTVSDIDEARTYVIRNYGVTFKKACEDIEYWGSGNGFLNYYTFEMEE